MLRKSEWEHGRQGKLLGLKGEGQSAWERRLGKGEVKRRRESTPGASYLPLSLASHFVALLQEGISLRVIFLSQTPN